MPKVRIEAACCDVSLAVAPQVWCGSDCDCACCPPQAVEEMARTSADWSCC